MFRLALASSRFASPPFSFPIRPKVNFSIYLYTCLHIYIYIYLGEKSEFIDLSSDSYPPILILPSLLPCLLSSLFIRPTDANRHTLLYPTLLVKTIRPLVNLPPRFSSHIRLTGKKNRERGEGGGGEGGKNDRNLRSSARSRSNVFERVRIDLVPISCIFSTPDIDRKPRPSFINIVT